MLFGARLHNSMWRMNTGQSGQSRGDKTGLSVPHSCSIRTQGLFRLACSLSQPSVTVQFFSLTGQCFIKVYVFLILFSQSCIIKRYCEKRFVSKYMTTIGIDYGVTK